MKIAILIFSVLIFQFAFTQDMAKGYTYGYTTTAVVITSNPQNEAQSYKLSTGSICTFNGNPYSDDSLWILSIYQGDHVLISEFQDAYGTAVDYVDNYTFNYGNATNTAITYLGNAGGNNLLVETKFTDSALFILTSDGLMDRKIKITLLEDEIIAPTEVLNFLSFDPINKYAVINTGVDEEIEVKLYSISGLLLDMWRVTQTLTIDMSTYSEYLYFFKAEIKDHLFTQKIINY